MKCFESTCGFVYPVRETWAFGQAFGLKIIGIRVPACSALPACGVFLNLYEILCAVFQEHMRFCVSGSRNLSLWPGLRPQNNRNKRAGVQRTAGM